MSHTNKHRDFYKEPLFGKPVSDIPGVGAVLAKQLNDLGYHKAIDLYHLLKRFKFSEREFYEWMKEHCNGGHVRACYNALELWHKKNGFEYNDDVHNLRRGISSRVSRRSVLSTKPTSRPLLIRRPTQSGNVRLSPNPWGTDPTSSFFYSMSETVKKFPRVLQSQIKSQVFEIINDTETNQAEHEARTQASQWRNTPAHSRDPRVVEDIEDL